MIFENDEDEYGNIEQGASLFFGDEIQTRTENKIFTMGQENVDSVFGSTVGEIIFKDKQGTITVKEIIEMRNEIRRLQEEVDYLRKLQEL